MSFASDTGAGAQALTWNRLAAPLAVGACLAGAGALIVADADPNDGPILCPYRRLSGMYCPGCGLSRATHYLFRGNVLQAFSHHLFIIPVLAFLVATWWGWLLTAARRPTRLPGMVTPGRAWTAVGVLLAFAVVRNLPGLEFLIGG